MQSEPVTVVRQAIHSRRIHIDGFKRSDGLWDIEGSINDVKQIDHMLTSGVRPAGEPIHHMTLCLTLDNSMTIIAARALTQAMPYPGTCENITPEYAKLQGLKIEAGFTRKVAQLFGGARGCTHITELLGRMATGAIQAMAGHTPRNPDVKPFQLNGCHAFASDGALVAQYYPRWYLKAG